MKKSDRTSNTQQPIISLQGIKKAYDTPTGPFTALHDIDLTIYPKEFVAIIGKSGSGKTTMLNILAGIDRPTGGALTIADARIHGLSESELSTWRGKNIGLVFQFFQLLPTLTVAENIMLAMDLVKVIPADERRPRTIELLKEVGIADQADKLPSSLSGGQQQRAAIARALANNPPLLLCDEPTGNLDSKNREIVLDLFAKLNKRGHTIVMITHERDAGAFADRQVTLVDGRIVEDSRG